MIDNKVMGSQLQVMFHEIDPWFQSQCFTTVMWSQFLFSFLYFFKNICLPLAYLSLSNATTSAPHPKLLAIRLIKHHDGRSIRPQLHSIRDPFLNSLLRRIPLSCQNIKNAPIRRLHNRMITSILLDDIVRARAFTRLASGELDS